MRFGAHTLRSELPAPEEYNTYCRECWRQGGPMEPAQVQEVSSSSSESSVTDEEPEWLASLGSWLGVTIERV